MLFGHIHQKGKFNIKTQGVEGESFYETNVLINQFKTLIMELIRKLQLEGTLTSNSISDGVKQIREKLTNPNYTEQNSNHLLVYIERHISRSSSVRKPATLKQYRASLKKLVEFEVRTNTKLTFDKIDYDFYNRIIQYTQNHLNLSTNSQGTLIKNIKMWMNCSYEEGLHTNLIFRSKSFKKPVESADTIYLNEEELNQIRNLILPTHLENVRDLFLLACYTGVRSQDYNKLNKDHYIKNGTMLKIRTEKTDEEVIIPIHPEAKRIIDKYNGTPKMISNQKFNQYIKAVCRFGEIDETISITRTIGGKKKRITQPKYMFVSSHTARRSFATNAYKAGVPSLAIMSMTGHRTEKVFLKYIRVSKEEHAKLVSGHKFFGFAS